MGWLSIQTLRRWARLRSFGVLVGLSVLAPAQTRTFSGIVETQDGQRLPHVEVRIANVGNSQTTDSGEFEISLPARTEAGQLILISVAGWIVVDPHVGGSGKTYLPKAQGDPLIVVVSRKGNPNLLFNQQLIQKIVEDALSKQASSKSSSFAGQNPVLPTSFSHDEFLADTAKELGFSVPQLKSAIEEWSKKVREPYQKGLTALYAGHYGEATPNIQQSIGASETDLIDKYVALSTAEYKQGNFQHAEAGLLKARAIRSEDPLVLDNLGKVLVAEGRYAEAEPLLRRAQEIDVQTLGPEHPDVARDISHLAWLFEKQGKYSEAESLFKQALALEEKQAKASNPLEARDLADLAWLYEAQGRYEEAEVLVKRAEKIDEQVLGAEHPTTTDDLSTLALLYDDQGKYEQSQALYERVLKNDEQVFGPNSFSVATDLVNMGKLYHDWQKHEDEEPIYKHALDIEKAAVGPNHPNVAIILNSLAELYRMDHRYAEAERLYHQALQIDEEALGSEHPDVGMILHNLGALYKDQQKYSEAEPLFEHALAIYEKAFGPEHPRVAVISDNIAANLTSLGRAAEAKPYREQAERIRAKNTH